MTQKLRGVLNNSQRTNFDFIKGTTKEKDLHMRKCLKRTHKCIQDIGPLKMPEPRELIGTFSVHLPLLSTQQTPVQEEPNATWWEQR